MRELREFKVNLDGIPHTFQLDQVQAERHGLEWDTKKKPAAKVAAPKNKAAKPADK